jgi:hypothetical protein
MTEIIDKAYPLNWPPSQPRTPKAQSKFSRFKTPYSRSKSSVQLELKRMHGISQVVISSNVRPRNSEDPYPEVQDNGVAVYFVRDGKAIALACDSYVNVAANMRAIALTLKALRDIERYGSTELLDRAFTGFTALPAHVMKRPWYDVLGVSAAASFLEIKEAYLKLAEINHPDKPGGDLARFQEITEAWNDIRSRLT